MFEPVSSFIPSFLIGTFDRNGKLRPDLSRTRWDRTEAKYTSPKGVGVVIFGPRPDSFEKFAAAKVKYIAEGEGKALALAKLGLPVLGIGGVHCWHLKGESTLHADLDGVKKGDTVYLAVDGDCQTNDSVRSGAAGELFAIKAKGAVPKLFVIDPELGIDDQIKLWRDAGKDPLAELAKLPTVSELKTPDDVPLTSDADILTRPPPEWIVKGVIPPGELTAIVGETSCGKTFLTMDLLLAVARKEPFWFGQRIKRHGLTVHITLEGTGLGNRRRAYQQYHKLTGTLPYVAIESPINLRDPATTDALITSIDRARVASGLPVVLIAVDTVNRALGGGDENSSADMGAFLGSAERLKSAFPGSGVLLVHHLGKDPGRGARGHSSFSANVGAELAVEHDLRSGIRTASVQKQRDGRTDLRFNFILRVVELGHDEDQEPITSCVVEPSAAPVHDVAASDLQIYQWIYAWNMTENGGKQPSRETLRRNKGNICGKVRMSKDEFINAVEAAITNGWIVAHPAKRGGENLELLEPKQAKY